MSAFVPSSFLGASPTRRTFSLPAPSPRRAAGPRMSSSVLIVNAKGGGHGHIGLHLARALLTAGNKVHIHQLGAEKSKGPIAQYPTLASEFPANFSVEYGDVPQSYGSFDAVYDNNAKSADDIAPAIAAGKAGAKVFYVSSAGSYAYNDIAPHVVGAPAKGPTIDVEDSIRAAGVSTACFRPIYIIGPHTSKREYIDFFFDRIVRDRPIPLPGSGEELTSITDVRDVADLMAAAVDKSMKDEIINSVNTRTLTFNAMVKLCADACGKEAQTVNYDPKEMAKKIDNFQVKKAFPFRPRHFFANPEEAVVKLGWQPKVSGTKEGLAAAIKECYSEYVQLGLDKAEVDFSLDDKIMANM